jgi:hypothetical protein
VIEGSFTIERVKVSAKHEGGCGEVLDPFCDCAPLPSSLHLSHFFGFLVLSTRVGTVFGVDINCKYIILYQKLFTKSVALQNVSLRETNRGR